MSSVQILVFAALREAIGSGTVSIDVPASATLTGQYLLTQLAKQFPAAESYILSTPLILAADSVQVPSLDSAISTTAEIAIFPPVSGG